MYKKAGSKAPAFKAPDQDGTVRSLKDYVGKWVILYFYPKDDTPGCTKEACSLRDGFSQFKRAGIEVIGVSVDSIKKHQKFVEKYSLPFTLLSDEDKKIVEAYGVWGLKKFMGREYMGTNRVSYLIDPTGKIAKVYESVKPDAHADEVLVDVKSFKK
jgi:peroxiredoxin Q/BCP